MTDLLLLLLVGIVGAACLAVAQSWPSQRPVRNHGLALLLTLAVLATGVWLATSLDVL